MNAVLKSVFLAKVVEKINTALLKNVDTPQVWMHRSGGAKSSRVEILLAMYKRRLFRNV